MVMEALGVMNIKKSLLMVNYSYVFHILGMHEILIEYGIFFYFYLGFFCPEHLALLKL